MKPQSRRTLLWFGAILLVVGGVTLSPLASLLLSAMAALCALPSLFSGSGMQRWIGLALLVGALGLGIVQFEKGNEERKQYQRRATSPQTQACLQISSRDNCSSSL